MPHTSSPPLPQYTPHPLPHPAAACTRPLAHSQINDRYEFPERLDLDNGCSRSVLSTTCDRSTPNVYRLHAVLVHSGGVHGGHYYAFIRPDGVNWLKFDDERVTKVEQNKAMDDQFGG